jgi:MFS superfamily sulfate permease-like transporter
MTANSGSTTATSFLTKDIAASVVVFLVALPLCLGVALASNAPLFSGVIAGIVGGIVVGLLSGSHKSVSGPAAGLTAIVAMEISQLGTFEAFLAAVVLAGAIQIAMGVARAGFIAAFFPSSVIKGLLAAIGIIIVLKQIPHLIGHDLDPMGDKSFRQPDNENTFTELAKSFLDIHPGAAVVGLGSLALLLGWERVKVLKKSPVPAALVAVVFGVGLSLWFRRLGGPWEIETSHLVQVPNPENLAGFFSFLQWPDFSAFAKPTVYTAALTIAIVASLETLLNVEAVDKLDPDQRITPPNRELIAQGTGNMLSGLIGGLPMTSVIVRSSANITAGAKTKLSAILHGVLLLLCVVLMPGWLNQIPLAALAAILIVIGIKLSSFKLMRQMWKEGRSQFLPFIITVLAIVLTDLLTGILIGLGASILFILHSNFRRPLRRVIETHVGGDVLRIELANQVSFLNRATLEKTLHEVPRGGHVLIDARNTNYIDPDIRDLIEDFRTKTAEAHGVKVSMVGFKDDYQFDDHIQYVDYTNRDLQSSLNAERVLKILQEGNDRFLRGERLTRDYGRQVDATAAGQFPMAVVLSCIDSRTPAEPIFDLGLGDIFSCRVAGNIVTPELLGSMEFGCAVAGAKLVLVMGHTSCGAVNASINLLAERKTALEATGCDNLDSLVREIQQCIDPQGAKPGLQARPEEKAAYSNRIAERNVVRTIQVIRQRSKILDRLVREGRISIVGAVYDVHTGRVKFFQTPESSTTTLELPLATPA